jgi:hypothetical protein
MGSLVKVQQGLNQSISQSWCGGTQVRRLRWEDCEFQASLGSIARPYLKTNKKLPKLKQQIKQIQLLSGTHGPLPSSFSLLEEFRS